VKTSTVAAICIAWILLLGGSLEALAWGQVPPPPGPPPAPPRGGGNPPVVPAATTGIAANDGKRALDAYCASNDAVTNEKGPNAERVATKTSCGRVAQLEGGFPLSYYSARAGFDFCASLNKIRPADAIRGTDAYLHLQTACRAGHARSGLLLPIGVNAVQGLGDFLVARAKKELVGFAIEKEARTICEKDFKEVSPTTKIELFADTCSTLFPNGPKNDPDLGAVADGRLVAALRTDLIALPDKLIRIGVPTDPKWAHLDEVFTAAAHSLYKLVRHGVASRFFADVLDSLVSAQVNTQAFACDVASNRSAACLTMLLVEVGDTTIEQLKTTKEIDPLSIIDEAAGDFCRRFSSGGGTPGACVFGAGYEKWQPTLVAFIRTTIDFRDVGQSVKTSALTASAAASSREASDPSASKVSDALDELFDALEKAVLKLADSKPGVQTVLDLARAAERIASGALSRDQAKIITAIRTLVKNDAAWKALGLDENKAVSLLVSLAMAETRADVEAVLEDQAAPLGSYSAKYGDAGAGRFTVNGYVGPIGGGQRFIHVADGMSNEKQWFYRFSAPVGLDLTVLAWSHIHLGLGTHFIDPLALTVVTEDGVVAKADWASLVDLGVYLRAGLGGSPLSLVVAGDYLPGLTSSETCVVGAVSGPCWRGVWQLGASLAVDIPIWIIN
jgi:hypothetical protein